MKSLSSSKVIKSTVVSLGQKKEIDFNLIYSSRIIKDHIKQLELPEQEEISAEEKSRLLLEEASEESRLIIENAKRDVEVILEEAYRDSKKILENARNEGFQKGLREGHQMGFQQYQELLDEARALKQQMLEEKKLSAHALEKDIVRLVIESVRKVIKHEISESHEIMLNLVREGINKCTFTESLIVRVSEMDYDLISAYKNRVYMMTEGIEDIEIKTDAALSSGSVIIETASGRVDSSVGTQMEIVENLFYELLQGE
jgi:flagellar assembly protein FliH